jgi:hypothetical protein
MKSLFTFLFTLVVFLGTSQNLKEIVGSDSLNVVSTFNQRVRQKLPTKSLKEKITIKLGEKFSYVNGYPVKHSPWKKLMASKHSTTVYKADASNDFGDFDYIQITVKDKKVLNVSVGVSDCDDYILFER